MVVPRGDSDSSGVDQFNLPATYYWHGVWRQTLVLYHQIKSESKATSNVIVDGNDALSV